MKSLFNFKNTSKVKLKHLILDLLYPRSCITCSKTLKEEEKFICIGCLLELPISEKESNTMYFEEEEEIKVYSFFQFTKKGKSQKIIHEMKYRGNEEVARWIGELYGNKLSKTIKQDKNNLLIPVPLHKQRKKQRGYNQAEEIGKGLQKTLEMLYDDGIVERMKKTETQTKKNLEERKRNIEEAFEMKDISKIRAKNVYIVDDVITTGATVRELIKQLKKGHPKEISIITIASVK